MYFQGTYISTLCNPCQKCLKKKKQKLFSWNVRMCRKSEEVSDPALPIWKCGHSRKHHPSTFTFLVFLQLFFQLFIAFDFLRLSRTAQQVALPIDWFINWCFYQTSEQGKINCGVSSQNDFVQNYFLRKRIFRKQNFRKIPTFSPFWSILGPIWSLFDFTLTRSCAALRAADLGSSGQNTFHTFLRIYFWNCYLFVSHQLYLFVSCQKVFEHNAKIWQLACYWDSLRKCSFFTYTDRGVPTNVLMQKHHF